MVIWQLSKSHKCVLTRICILSQNIKSITIWQSTVEGYLLWIIFKIFQTELLNHFTHTFQLLLEVNILLWVTWSSLSRNYTGESLIVRSHCLSRWLLEAESSSKFAVHAKALGSCGGFLHASTFCFPSLPIPVVGEVVQTNTCITQRLEVRQRLVW